MAERGGPTVQSGLHYQNSVAAFFLGRLCDMQRRPAWERVVEVRLEAPTEVDDIVVTYADHHTEWVQAKERLRRSTGPWRELWADFEAQRWGDRFAADDRLVLATGATGAATHHDLRALARRARGAAGVGEWRATLTKSMSSVVDNIRGLLSPEHRDDESLLSLFSCVDVWPVSTLRQIERDELPRWMPPSSREPATLFALLRDRAGGGARYREIFRKAPLLEELANKHQVFIREPRSYGVSAYRQALAQVCSRLEVPGTGVGGSIEKMFLWPTLKEKEVEPTMGGLVDEEYRSEGHGPERGAVDLRHFPHPTIQRAVVVAGAGFGKTALVTAVAHRLASTSWLPALVPLAEFAESGLTVMEFLEDSVNRQFNVAIPWDYYCESGRAVILFDGLDELPPNDRVRILQSIRYFSGRYADPAVAWLLTVRDAAALPAPAAARLLTIDTFDDDEIASFAWAYREAGSAVDPVSLLSELQRHRDLRLLARIPLFLALLLATTGSSDPLPRARSDLIEHYLHIVFHPQEYKPAVQLQCDSHELRRVGQHLAFAALEREKVALAEREVDDILGPLQRNWTTDEYLADLTACGLLARSTNLIGFAFPIVQEYLAGCYLAEHLPDDVADRLRLYVKRPWAQTLQFAVERHPKADRIVNDLLDQPDDAFGTVLRLLGRCIINGAAVSRQTRDLVGDRLADLWMSRSWHVANNVGQLIADGFTSPLPSRVRQLLASGRRLGVGGPDILTAANDPELTLCALRAFLMQDLEYQFHLHHWQAAVDVVAFEALQYYVARAKSGRTSTREMKPLASLISNLSPEHLPPRAYESVTNDGSLPTVVRLAGYFLGPRPLPAEALTLADGIMRAPKPEDEHGVPGWPLAIDALWQSEGPVALWASYVCDTSLFQERRQELLFTILDSPLDASSQVAALAGLPADDTLPADIRHSALLLRAYLGDAQAMRVVTGILSQLSRENRSTWAFITSKYRSGDLVYCGLRQLEVMHLAPDDRVRIASDLAFGLTMDVDLLGYPSGAAGTRRAVHPAASECARIVWRWTCDYAGDVRGCLTLLRASCELGQPGAAQMLADVVSSLIEQNGDLFRDADLDQHVSNALYSLELVSHPIEAHTLERCVEISEFNAATRAASMIAACGSEQALDILIELHTAKAKRYPRENMLSLIEELASRLGVRLLWDGDRLARQP